jgi:O-antigen ligase
MKYYKLIKENASYILLSVFWLFALFNPMFKKYDYGGGWPVLLVFGVILAVVAFFEFRKKREKGVEVLWEKIFLLIFLAAIVASFVFSQTKNIGFSEVFAWGAIVPMYFLFAHQRNIWAEKFLRVVVIGTVAAVILGYALYFFRAETRFIGPFFNTLYHAHVWPNAFALFLIMTWPVLLLFFEKKGKWATSLLIGFVLSGLLLTFSRGALIVLGGQFALLLIYFLKRIRLKTVLLAVLALVFAAGLFLEANYFRSFGQEVVDISERVGFENTESLTSAQERIDFWEGAIELAGEKPLFGWGPFSFRYAYNPIQKTFLGNADHPHNLFLKIAAENGLIALGAFLAFLITVFVCVVRRFPKLSQKKKDAVYILFVAVAGAFAHNLIDYNLNFTVNLVTLFMLIIFIRSLVIKRAAKVTKAVIAFVLAIIIGFISLYEGGLLFLDHEIKDKSYMAYSFYPRNYYLNLAESALTNDYFDLALYSLNHQLLLNPLDAQAWYLKGAVYCDEDYENHVLELCRDSFGQAMELSPMNDFEYYRAYIWTLIQLDMEMTDPIIFGIEIKSAKDNIEIYFEYVENNVHFTAYTNNVESAADLVDLIIPYLSEEEVEVLMRGKDNMLEQAEKMRSEKTF